MDKLSDKLASLRKEYMAHNLDAGQVKKNPFQQFRIWFDEALETVEHEVNAMTLATVDAEGKPSARVVLLKGFDEDGLVFYTNYNSRKGLELEVNPNAALVFYWHELERQVRIEGIVEKVSSQESKAYFQSRPKGSQIGAHASPQSEVIDSRSVLEDKVKTLSEQFANTDVLPRPQHWGGYRLIPNWIEFWQGRASRLHDRICYRLDGNKHWIIERLAP